MKIYTVKLIFFSLFMAAGIICKAQKRPTTNEGLKTLAIADIQSNYETYRKTALQIWGFAEVGYKEEKSSALLQQTLTDNGFTVDKGVAGIPTAFIASYGSGKPVIAILAEFDAFPGLSQEAIPEKKPIAN